MIFDGFVKLFSGEVKEQRRWKNMKSEKKWFEYKVDKPTYPKAKVEQVKPMKAGDFKCCCQK